MAMNDSSVIVAGTYTELIDKAVNGAKMSLTWISMMPMLIDKTVNGA